MKHGSVSQRHTRSCPRADGGSYARHRCRGSWQWVLEYGRDSDVERAERATIERLAAAAGIGDEGDVLEDRS